MGRLSLKRRLRAIVIVLLLCFAAIGLAIRYAYPGVAIYIADQPGTTANIESLFEWAPDSWSRRVVETALAEAGHPGRKYMLLVASRRLDEATRRRLAPEISAALWAESGLVREAAVGTFSVYPEMMNAGAVQRVKEIARDPNEDNSIRLEAVLTLTKAEEMGIVEPVRPGHDPNL